MENFYCTICLEDKDHKFTVDGNGEFVATCDGCGHILKFPADYKVKDIKAAAKIHKEENEGKVSLAEQEKVLEELKV